MPRYFPRSINYSLIFSGHRLETFLWRAEELVFDFTYCTRRWQDPLSEIATDVPHGRRGRCHIRAVLRNTRPVSTNQHPEEERQTPGVSMVSKTEPLNPCAAFLALYMVDGRDRNVTRRNLTQQVGSRDLGRMSTVFQRARVTDP
jgi:hypothetical protein